MASDSYTRCNDLWFDDGNVVLEAGGTVFRVYRGILARNSEVFDGMFAFPQPVTDVETYEGSPLVHLPDRAIDLEVFLKAIHDAGYYNNHDPTPFFVVAGILRLATKYNVPYLRSRAIRQLDYKFPSTWEQYDNTSRQLHFGEIAGTDLPQLADLARETNVLSILPSAFMPSLRELTEGILDSTFAPEDKRACLLARDELRSRHAGMLATLCTTLPNACAVENKPCLKYFLKHQINNEAALSVWPYLSVLKRGRVGSWAYGPGVCESCAAEIETNLRVLQRTTWEALPQILGLPSWQELRTTTFAGVV